MMGDLGKKLVDGLLADLRNLSAEAKKKYPVVRQAAEGSVLKIRTISAKEEDTAAAISEANLEVLQPLVLGCDSRCPKLVQISLTSIQRLISHRAVSESGAEQIVAVLWGLMEAGMEELKVLQTILVLITMSNNLHRDPLAKAIVVCFRLHFSKDSSVANTAAATVQQVVSVVFERLVVEDGDENPDTVNSEVKDKTTSSPRPGKKPPVSLGPCAADAYLLFQDLCQLVNADSPYWLVGMTEMTRTFGLELVENILTQFSPVFFRHPEFSFLLKERVCPLVIKLFSPNIKFQQSAAAPSTATAAEKPYFPISMRLLRLVYALISNYYTLLMTECEIFLSLLVKFLDADKPSWQRVLAVEVLHKICVQPNMLRCFCQSYDMKQHSTKVFRDLNAAVGSYIQTLFLLAPSSSAGSGGSQSGSQGNSNDSTPPAVLGGLPVAGGTTPPPAFEYRGMWIPLLFHASAGVAKPTFLEMLDKTDPPAIPEGYGLSVAFACLLDCVRSISTIISSILPPQPGGRMQKNGKSRSKQVVIPSSPQLIEPADQQLCETLATSSWTSVLAALSLLLDSSMDESATQSILLAIQTFASICGQLGLNVPRDAFVTTLCKACLPPHYALTILNTPGLAAVSKERGLMRMSSKDSSSQHVHNSAMGDQVVAVGTSLPTTSSSSSAQVMLTVKNIQCMRSLLDMAHCHGPILGTAWHLVLTTLQHLVWVLGLKPAAGGSLKASTTDAPNAVLTTTVLTDLPVLSNMLSRLFESSQYLDEVAIHHLIDALSKLSQESMDAALANREPSLFPVAKLLETGLVNLNRAEILWRPVTAHLLEVSQHAHGQLRDWGAEAITQLVKAALAHDYEPPLKDNKKLQGLLLTPLQELCQSSHVDVRQKQLDCVLQVLQNNGDNLGHAWPVILEVLGAATDQGEALIRTAFQSLQLVVTDFLPAMPSVCLQVCITVATRFGLQKRELNISLTSIGLLWNISDFLYQNKEKIRADLEQDYEQPSTPTGEKSLLGPSDSLWMCLYSRLADLCVDSRPAVRKSACQTLFSTIQAHGTQLEATTWETVLWQVLFPLLDRVKAATGQVQKEDDKQSSTNTNILIHHSRDTAEKQWAETRVLTLAGVARVFCHRRHALARLDGYPRAWALLLEHVESAALSPSSEVSVAALHSFQELLVGDHAAVGEQTSVGDHTSVGDQVPDGVGKTDGLEQAVQESAEDQDRLWSNAWRVWYSIGTSCTVLPQPGEPPIVPSQQFLATLVQIFPPLFNHISSRFVASDLDKFAKVVQTAVSVPVHADASPFLIPLGGLDSNLSPLQDSVLRAVEGLQKVISVGPELMQAMYPAVFDLLLTFVQYSCQPPKYGTLETRSTNGPDRNSQVKLPGKVQWVTLNYSPFSEKSLVVVVDLYKKTACHKVVIQESVLEKIIKVVRLPLGLKYACPSTSMWKLAAQSLLQVLEVGLPVARQPTNEPSFSTMWTQLGLALDNFLFSKHPAPPTLSVEQHQKDEAIDVQMVELMRQDILPHADNIPAEFTQKVISLLNKGSIHSTTFGIPEGDMLVRLRENFSRVCFKTLLEYSLATGENSADDGGITKLALTAFLQRAQDVLVKYTQDERLSGKLPLPRHRMTEVTFVLRAVTTLLTSLKVTAADRVDMAVWDQAIRLYPALVECVTSSSPQLSEALRETLHLYADLLAAPQRPPPAGAGTPARRPEPIE
ncbi:protein MON2 homolog isoform X1 [Branchiostoma floridae x Branchiostoma japonicum]